MNKIIYLLILICASTVFADDQKTLVTDIEHEIIKQVSLGLPSSLKTLEEIDEF